MHPKYPVGAGIGNDLDQPGGVVGRHGPAAGGEWEGADVQFDALGLEGLFGLAVLSRLTDGTVHVCKGEASLPHASLAQVKEAVFVGPHPAGLPGTHIHFLDPVGAKKVQWHINYQDVIAYGKLFTTGQIFTDKVIALAGPNVIKPRLLRTRLGAVVRQLEDDRQIAMVADDGHVWLGAVEPQQQFRVTWGDNQQCRFTLPSHLENSMQLILPCQ